MKVTIRLTQEQVKRLSAGIAAHNAEFSAYLDQVVACGDLMQPHHPALNSNQSIRLVGHEVRLEGERHALRTDGILEMIARAISKEANCLFTAAHAAWSAAESGKRAGLFKAAWSVAEVAFREVSVISYESSESRLAWWETMEDLAPRLTAEEISTWPASRISTMSMMRNPSVARANALIVEYQMMRPSGQRLMSIINWRKVSAELTSAELTILKKMATDFDDSWVARYE